MSIVPGTGLSSARIDLWEYNDASSIASQMRFTYNYAWETGFKLQILDGIEVNFACEVPTNEWFKMSLHCNFHADEWEVLINDLSQGVFHNAPSQVSVISFKPFNGDSYFIDDVYYEYEPYTAPELGLAISAIESADWANQISQPYYWNRNKLAELVGYDLTPQLQFRNTGNETITSFDFTLQYNGESYTEQISNINLPPSGNYRWQSAVDFTVNNQSENMTASVSAVNGSTLEPVYRTIEIVPIIPNEYRKVLFEASTATWCPVVPSIESGH